MRHGIWWAGTMVLLLAAGLATAGEKPPEWATKDIKAGVIGTDTSHVPAFCNILHANPHWRVRVVAAFPGGSPDVKSSHTRVKGFAKAIHDKHQVELVESIAALLERVDVVLLQSVDGRPHLAQATPVLKAGKRLWIDKPFTASLEDAQAIVRLSKDTGTPFFTSSCLRFQPEAVAWRKDAGVGKVKKVETQFRISYEPHHPDLFWYGIHGVETLYTVMGRGCVSVSRRIEGDFDITTGTWADGRVGVFRGVKKGDYKPLIHVWGSEGEAASTRSYGYQEQCMAVARFFHTGEVPVEPLESLEIIEFMIAAQLSNDRKGAEVKLAELRKER